LTSAGSRRWQADSLRGTAVLGLSLAIALIPAACRSAKSAADIGATESTVASTSPPSQPIDSALAVETFDAAWTIVRDTHFDRNYNGVDWNSVRDELRPRAESATTVGELRGTIDEMLGRLGQSHFALLPREMVDEFKDNAKENESSSTGGDSNDSQPHDPAKSADRSDETDASRRPGDVGFDFRIIDGRVAVTSVSNGGPAEAAGLARGTEITEIEGVAVDKLLALIPGGLEPRMHNLHAWGMINSHVSGDEGRDLTLTVREINGKDRIVTFARAPVSGELVQFGNLPTFVSELKSWREPLSPYGGSGEAGVIWFNIWMGPLAPLFDAAIDDLRGTEGMILDLRGNPGGVGGMSMGFAGHFVDEKQTLGVMSTREANMNFIAMPRIVSAAGQRVDPYSKPLAILIDGLSGSTTEIFAGGMQSMGRARIFGEASMGAALPALMDELPNGDVLLHAFADFVTGTGVRLEGRGVIPDEPVGLTLEDLRAHRDPVMETALRWLAAQATPGKDHDSDAESRTSAAPTN
jgi:carboxyl-terminal processing protease